MTRHEFLVRAWEMLIGRDHGPMTFRLILQPLTALILAIRAGLRDARQGCPPCFFWSVFAHARGSELLRKTWKDVHNVFIVAIVLDTIYEWIVYRWVYPGQALIVATVLAIVPYVLMHGPITCVARYFVGSAKNSNGKST